VTFIYNVCIQGWLIHVSVISCSWVATGQEMATENTSSSRSRKSQRIVFWFRENGYFEGTPGKIEVFTALIMIFCITG